MPTTNLIIRKISEKDLEAILLAMDIEDDGAKRYMYDVFFNAISNEIPEYALGFSGANPSIEEIRAGANALFKIKKEADTNAQLIEKLNKKGFFGEIILHYLLKTLFNTIPLISKIYFKDSKHEAFGHDAVHVEGENLYLGEVKFYGLDNKNKTREKQALADLLNDIKCHFKRDYLNDQFSIIKKNLGATDHPQRDEWVKKIESANKLSDKFKLVRVPLLCTYECGMVSEAEAIKDDFDVAFELEMRRLKKHFDDNNTYANKANLEIILILFPVESKKRIVEGIFNKLVAQQNL